MDHIPLPPGATPPLVPYVAEDYEQGDFAAFPERKGKHQMLETLDFQQASPEESQAFFQTWLYFGCLVEVFRVVSLDVDTKRFVRETESGRVVDSTALHVYTDEWKFRDTAYRYDEARRLIWGRICAVLNQVRAALNGPVEAFNRYLATRGAENELPCWPNIALSIGLLGRTLQEVGYRLKYAAPKDWDQYQWGYHPVLEERLRYSGWCRAETKRFMAAEPMDFVYYVGALTSPRAHDDHSECEETVCRGKAANVAAYRTKHAAGCDGGESCKFWVMPEESVKIVGERGIPLAHWSDSSGLEVLRLADRTAMPYVAISHVWSDGKGNADQNALPECQLRLIQQKIDKLYSVPRRSPRPVINMYGPRELHPFRDPWRQPVGFWMDTLCVPVGDEHKQLRKQTIDQMREIYEGADRVLVLDDWMEDLPLSSSIDEKAARIYLSNWQHRLWTLQEGALAQQLSIQFKDGPMTLEEIKDISYQAGSNGSSPEFYSTISGGLAVVPIFNLYFALDLEKDKLPTVGDLFTPLIPTINGRTTTKFEDETVCMATLLRLNTSTLQAISTSRAERKRMTREEAAADDARICDARMKKFLCMVGSFEQRIIFNHLPRMTSDGFRWAPRSFLGQSKPTMVATADTSWDRKERAPPATLSTEQNTGSEDGENVGGLIVTYPGIKLRNVTLHQLRAGTVYMTRGDHGSFLYRVSLELPTDFEPEEEEQEEKQEEEEKEVSKSGASGYALVTSAVLRKTSNEAIPSVFGILRGQTETGVYRLQHICLATVEAPDQSKAREQIRERGGSSAGGIPPDPEEKTSEEKTSGVWLNSKKNQWCIM